MTPTEVHAALARIAPHIQRTPMLRSAALDRLTGARVVIKPEVLQRTGSFKLRGATNALLQLSPEARQKGVVTYSSGNHGQAIACAAAALGMAAVIVMPSDAPAIKRDSTAFWGAVIIQYDRATENREAIAQAIVAETGAALIPPYEHPHVIAGQGTLALELAEDVAGAGLAMDALLVPTGGADAPAGGHGGAGDRRCLVRGQCGHTVSKRSLLKKLRKTFLLLAFQTPREAEQKFFGYFFSKK
jgi:threonine dehydratase